MGQKSVPWYVDSWGWGGGEAPPSQMAAEGPGGALRRVQEPHTGQQPHLVDGWDTKGQGAWRRGRQGGLEVEGLLGSPLWQKPLQSTCSRLSYRRN